jgi:hypothetical protein
MRFQDTKKNKIRMNHKKILLLIFLAAVLLVGSGVFAYNRWFSDPTLRDPTINYGPPTEKEQEVGDDIKKDIVEEDKQEQGPQPTIKKASVVITDASQYGNEIEVRSFVSNIYENGTCTITFTKGSSSFSKQSPATKEASNTLCKAVVVPRSSFSSSGAWKVTVEYQSANAAGEASETLQVQ